MWTTENSSTHLLLHDGHGGPRQQEGLEWHQVPERVLHLVVAVDDVSPGLAGSAEEDGPGRGNEDGVSSPRTRDKAVGHCEKTCPQWDWAAPEAGQRCGHRGESEMVKAAWRLPSGDDLCAEQGMETNQK